MGMNQFIILSLFACFLCSCQSQSKKIKTNFATIQKDTSSSENDSVLISRIWVKPKKSFEFNSLKEFKEDTLVLVTCDEFVYSPFDKINDKSEIKNSALSKFSIADRNDTLSNGIFEFQILKLNQNRLVLFFDKDYFASKESYVLRGDIYDKSVTLESGIQIGITKKDFIQIFFDSFPKSLIDRYNVIIFESCVDGIKHTYDFQEDKLKHINFDGQGMWTIKY